MCNDFAIFISERALHQIIVKIPQNCFNVVILSCLFVGIPKFIIAPAQGRSGIVFRHTKLYMVASVMESAGNIHIAISIRVKNVPILVDERLRQVRADFIFSHWLQRHLCVIGVTVATPLIAVIFGNFCSAHIAIIEINGILQCFRIIILHSVRSRCLQSRWNADGCLQQYCYQQSCKQTFSNMFFLFHSDFPFCII